MDYVLTTDMTADMADDFLVNNNIDIVSMPYIIDGIEYGRDNCHSYPDFYNLMRNGAVASTSQVDLFDAELVFDKHLKNGKDILHISFSSGMSGSYDNLKIIANDLHQKYPDRKILIIDSLSGAGGEGLMVYYAFKKMQEGATINELANWCEDNKLNFRHYFIVEDLDHLKRGGRISKIEALLGKIMGIKPILDLSYSGKITPIQKAMGKNKAISTMIDHLKKKVILDKNDFILVSHGDCLKEAQSMGQKIKDVLGNIAVKYSYVNYLVGSHAGPNALAIFFYGEKRKKLLPI